MDDIEKTQCDTILANGHEIRREVVYALSPKDPSLIPQLMIGDDLSVRSYIRLPPSDIEHHTHEDRGHREVTVDTEMEQKFSDVDDQLLAIQTQDRVNEGVHAQEAGFLRLKNQNIATPAIRTSKVSQKDLALARMSTTKPATGFNPESTMIRHDTTVASYTAVLNSLTAALFTKHTGGQCIANNGNDEPVSLCHQALVYLILRNSNIRGIDESEVFLHSKNGALSSQLHDAIMPLLEDTATDEPFGLWIPGSHGTRPTLTETTTLITSWFMCICRKTIERLKRGETMDVRWKIIDCLNCLENLLEIGHGNLRMQRRRRKASLLNIEVDDGFAPPPKKC